METGRTTVASSRKSQVCRKKSGMQPRPLEPGAVQAQTKTVSICFGDKKLKLDADTFRVLLALLDGYMCQVLNGDLTALAFYSAKAKAEKMGVDEDTFCRLANEIFEANESRRKRHPFVAGGFM